MICRYLLDTNVLAALAREPSGQVARKIAVTGEACVCTSAIVACEVHYGLAKRRSARLTAQMTAILDSIAVLSLPAGVEVHYGQIRARLEILGTPIGPNDLLIAAHARASGLTVVTDNEREFRRVPDLHVENWVGNVVGSVAT